MDQIFGSKKALAVYLSKLEHFRKPKVRLEQYTLSSDTAATLLWTAMMNGDIREKVIIDLGTGTGILGIGALLLGAKMVYFVECDIDAIDVAQKNIDLVKSEYSIGNFELIHQKVSEFSCKNVDTILQNPPFGTKLAHTDKEFLEKAFSMAKSVYSIHKSSTMLFLQAIARDHKYDIAVLPQREVLKKTYAFHKKQKEFIEIVIVHFEKD